MKKILALVVVLFAVQFSRGESPYRLPYGGPTVYPRVSQWYYPYGPAYNRSRYLYSSPYQFPSPYQQYPYYYPYQYPYYYPNSLYQGRDVYFYYGR